MGISCSFCVDSSTSEFRRKKYSDYCTRDLDDFSFASDVEKLEHVGQYHAAVIIKQRQSLPQKHKVYSKAGHPEKTVKSKDQTEDLEIIIDLNGERKLVRMPNLSSDDTSESFKTDAPVSPEHDLEPDKTGIHPKETREGTVIHNEPKEHLKRDEIETVAIGQMLFSEDSSAASDEIILPRVSLLQ
jgi:hypothetical protein